MSTDVFAASHRRNDKLHQQISWLGVVYADPLDLVHEEAGVFKPHELAVVERLWAAEPEVDRVDRRVRLWQRGRVCGLADREGGVGWVGAGAAEIDRDVIAGCSAVCALVVPLSALTSKTIDP